MTGSPQPMTGVRYSFVRRRHGFELWRWEGNHGRNLSSQDGAGYPATLALARAWARGDAFRQGVPYAEVPKVKREQKPAPLTEQQRELRRIATLDGLAQRSFGGAPARAAEAWISSATACVWQTHYRPDRARHHAKAAAERARNAITCLEKWIAELQKTEPVRRLRIVKAPASLDVEGER